MKHAYLIIAHNEFEVLRRLVSALDDERNDIYVHIDKKVRTLPELQTCFSKLLVLEKRIDVRWGHVSQIKTELLLFETALKNGPYEFYHLISGTHMPLKSQDDIHSFFDNVKGKNLFSCWRITQPYQENLKVHKVNILVRYFSSPIKFVSIFTQLLWKTFVSVQRIMGILINNDIQFYCANNWCSLTEPTIEHLIERKKKIIHRYRWSYCGDEFFVPTELMQLDLADTVVVSASLLYGSIGRSNSSVLTMDDFDDMIASGCIFARKFSMSEPIIIDKIESILK